MSENSDFQEDRDDFIYFKDRPEWKDVVPIEQHKQPHQVLVINYSSRFVDCFNYFRAVFANGEKTKRVLDLTAEAILLNAANYTVWQYRRDVLQALGIPSVITKDGLTAEFQKEFQYSLETIEENQKNYQVWHHRKILSQWAGSYNDETNQMEIECDEAKQLLLNQELELTVRLLNKDSKNYHAWQHRQWIIDSFKYFKNEFEFVNVLLEQDVRNNSAWNQRYFALKGNGNITEDVINDEIAYTWERILKAPTNESPWSYLEGLYRLIPTFTLMDAGPVVKMCEELFQRDVRSPSMMIFMLNVYEHKLLKSKPLYVELFKRCEQICDLLATTVDKIRSTYWCYRKSQLKEKCIPENESNVK